MVQRCTTIIVSFNVIYVYSCKYRSHNKRIIIWKWFFYFRKQTRTSKVPLNEILQQFTDSDLDNSEDDLFGEENEGELDNFFCHEDTDPLERAEQASLRDELEQGASPEHNSCDQTISSASEEEIKSLLGILMSMGLVKLPALKDYWSTHPILGAPGIVKGCLGVVSCISCTSRSSRWEWWGWPRC